MTMLDLAKGELVFGSTLSMRSLNAMFKKPDDEDLKCDSLGLYVERFELNGSEAEAGKFLLGYIAYILKVTPSSRPSFNNLLEKKSLQGLLGDWSIYLSSLERGVDLEDMNFPGRDNIPSTYIALHDTVLEYIGDFLKETATNI